MHTCSKEYIDIPIAHRQHNHQGHCAQIHGHNWAFKFTFTATHLDKNGFVIDFGDLKELKRYIDRHDHALLLNQSDPHLTHLTTALNGYANIIIVESASSEGLAKMFCEKADQIVQHLTNGRVRCTKCECTEDHKNSAQWTQPTRD